jgi:hypothetical protein
MVRPRGIWRPRDALVILEMELWKLFAQTSLKPGSSQYQPSK